jgi:hypothetical protein
MIAVADAAVVRNLNRFVTLASLLSIAVGLLGLIGWTLDVAALKSVFPGHTAIKPNAALALVLCGGSLWLLRSDGARPARVIRTLVGRVLASLVALVGLLALLEHLLTWDLGIDWIFFLDTISRETAGSARSGLMAPIIALDFLLL